MDTYLRKNKRSEQSSLIVIGAWLEGLYFETQMAKNNPSKKIRENIGTQKVAINNIMAILEAYKSDNFFKNVKSQMDPLKKLFDKGKKVVLDYIIFGNYLEFFRKFKKEFGNDLEIKVLFPTEKEMVKRDKDRECWTTGIDRILTVHSEFEAVKDVLGKDNFIDTTGQTPDDTLRKYFSERKEQL